MGDFFDSKFIKDLKNGQLPPVVVQFSPESLIQVAATMFFTGVALIVAWNIFKRLS